VAFASVGSLGTAQEKVSDTQLALAVTANAEVGNLVAVWVAMDNAGTADADTTQLAVTDDAGNEYVLLKERTESSGAANDGVVGAIFASRIKTQLNSGQNIYATSSSARTAKAMAAHEFTFGTTGFAIASTAVLNNTSGDPAAISLSSLTSRQYLLLWGFFQENVVTITAHDADYTAITGIATSGSTADTNVGVEGAFRIATLTADTVDATASAAAQHVQILAAIYEITAMDRVTQATAEAVVAPTSGKARTTQAVAEAIVAPIPPPARLTQVAAEAIVAPLPPNARETQAVVEAVQTPDDTERQRFWDAVRSGGPLAIWRLDDPSGNFLDTSGPFVQGTHPFVPSGTVSYGQPGPAAGWPAISVDGGGGSQSSFSTAMNDITFEAWFMPTSVDADHQVIFANVNGGQGWALLINMNGKLQVVVNGSTYLAESRASLDNGTWYHIVVMRRAGTWRYYLNGEVDTPNAGTAAPGSAVTTMKLLGSPDLQASMATAAYYERALTGGEVRDHYEAAFPAAPVEPLRAHWKAGTFTVPSGGGDVSVNVGARPKAVIFYGTNWTAEDTVVATTGTALFRGMVAPNYDDPSTLAQNAVAFSPGGDQHRIDNYAILNITTAGAATVLYRATVSLTDTGFTASFDTGASGGYKIVYVVLLNVRHTLGMVGSYSNTQEFGFKPDASLIHGALQGPVTDDDRWTSAFVGGAGYPGTNDLTWEGHAAGMVSSCYLNSVGQQFINELWNSNPNSIITTSNHFTGPFLTPSNNTALPVGDGLLDFAMSGDPDGGGMAVAWDDEVSDAGFTTPPANVDDETTVAVDGTRFGETPFPPGLVLSYSISNEPDDQGEGPHGAGGFGVATPDFQWSALVDSIDRGSYQSFSNGYADTVSSSGVHAGEIELLEDGFKMTTTVASISSANHWLWHAFGYPDTFLPQIYRIWRGRS